MEPQIELCRGEKTNEWPGVPVSRQTGAAKTAVSVLEERGSCRFAFPLDENVANEFALGNEGNPMERASALTLQRIDLIDAFDELRPTFSESGALFW